jgi:hypothetical protein
MPPKRRNFNKQQTKRGAGRRGGGRSTTGRNGKQLTCRLSGIDLPYILSATDSITGLIQASFVSPANASYVPIHPVTIGDRCAQLADVYQQWRLNRLTIRYKPFNYQGNVTTGSTNSGQGAYPTFASLSTLTSDVAGGFAYDSTTGALSFPEIIECGGTLFNLARPFVWTTSANRWMYTTVVGSDASNIRWVSPCQFNCASRANGAATPLMYGELIWEWDISFRYPLDTVADSVEMKASAVSPIDYIQIMKDKRVMKQSPTPVMVSHPVSPSLSYSAAVSKATELEEKKSPGVIQNKPGLIPKYKNGPNLTGRVEAMSTVLPTNKATSFFGFNS